MRLEIASTVFLACALAVTAQDRPSPVTTPIVYRVPGMETVKVKKDVVYRTLEGATLAMDIYTPAQGTDAGAPVVLLVSGTSRAKHWMALESTARVIAANGMGAIPFDKRYSRGSYYETESDLMELLAYLDREGGSLGLDPRRVCVVVYSGGGPLLSTFLRRGGERLHCVVAMYAALESDSWGAPPESPRRELAMEEFSPVKQIAGSAAQKPPVMVVRAGKDNPGLNASLEAFVKQAITSGMELEFVNHAQGRHGFDIIDPNDRSREIIARALEFLKAHLR